MTEKIPRSELLAEVELTILERELRIERLAVQDQQFKGHQAIDFEARRMPPMLQLAEYLRAAVAKREAQA